MKFSKYFLVFPYFCCCFITGCFIPCKDIKTKQGCSNLLFSSSDEVRVMTFNIRTDTVFDMGGRNWNQRKPLVFNTMNDYAPDIFGLQEARYNQVKEVAEFFPQYTYYGVGRNDGKTSGEFCPVFYRKDRFKLLDSGTFWFSKNPDKPGSKYFATVNPRICSWVYLKDKKGVRFYVYNVHLDPYSSTARNKSVLLLVQRIIKRKKDAPFILIGDFNVGFDDSVLEYLQDDKTNPLKMKSAWKTINPDKLENIGTRHFYSGSSNFVKTDHILFNDMTVLDIKIDKRNVEGIYPSDHFPIIAKLKI